MKWKALHALFVKELSKAKKGFYSKKIRHLRNAKPKQWHRELKKLTHFDKGLSEEVIVESIEGFIKIEQAEKIADKLSRLVRNMKRLKLKT